MTISDLDLSNRPLVLRYLIATLLVVAAIILTSLLWLIVDRAITAPLFLAAIVLSVWIGGPRLGVYTTFLAGLAIDYYFVEPFYSFSGTRDELVRMGIFIMEGVVLTSLSDRLRTTTKSLQTSQHELRALTQHQQTLREEEQKRIAREIHDELGQSLTGLKLATYVIRGEVAGNHATELLNKIDGLSDQIDETIGTVRRIASELRPSILDDFGLVAALEWQAAECRRKSGIECSFQSDLEDVVLEPESESAAFRIVQEALTNVSRHANASMISISIADRGEKILISVQDDGRGLDHEAISRGRSLGMLGMRERAKLIGADIEFTNSPGGGAVVELYLAK